MRTPTSPNGDTGRQRRLTRKREDANVRLMATDQNRTPNLRDAALEARRAREAREAEALRENLRRRKAQARARAEAPVTRGAGVLPDDTP